MWFVLDESLLEVDPANVLVRSAVEQFLYAVALGEHALAAKPAVPRRLLTFDLSPRPRAVLLEVLGRAPELLAALGESRYHVRIVGNPGDVKRVSGSEWTMSLDRFNASGVPKSVLLCENVRDGALYRESGKHHAIAARAKVKIALDLENGGGADTPNVLKGHMAAQNKFVLCITDSDKCCPSSAMNATSKECSTIASDPTWVAEHLPLRERELENVLPRALLVDAIEAKNAKDVMARLEQLTALAGSHTEAWEHFDLKDGTRLKDAFGSCGTFWRTATKHDICAKHSRHDCVASLKCAASSEEDCACLLAPALGQKIADHLLDHLKLCSPHAAEKRVSGSANGARWLEIGSYVSSWGAAGAKLRS